MCLLIIALAIPTLMARAASESAGLYLFNQLQQWIPTRFGALGVPEN